MTYIVSTRVDTHSHSQQSPAPTIPIIPLDATAAAEGCSPPPSWLQQFGPVERPYVEDVLRHWIVLQQHLASACCFDPHVHPEINFQMRSILIDWLWSVHVRLEVEIAAMFLTVQLVDRCLAVAPAVSRRDLQCLGMVCLLLASKFEEVLVPQLRDFTYLCDGAKGCDREGVIAMQKHVCERLEHDFALPTAFHFLTFYAQCVAAGCPRVLGAAFAAFHAVSLNKTSASAQPQHTAAGCLSWALCNRDLLPSIARLPVTITTTSESAEAMVDRQTHILQVVCGLSLADVAVARRGVLASIIALVALPDTSKVKAYNTSWLKAYAPTTEVRAHVHAICMQQ